MTTYHRLICFVALTCLILIVPQALAQSTDASPEQVLLYVRQPSQDKVEYIRLSNSGRVAYPLAPLPDCWVFSSDGQYIAHSSLQPDKLSLLHGDTMQPFLVTEWQTKWRPCSMIWITDSIISFARSDVANDSLRYDMSSGVLTPIAELPALRTPIPPLPEILQVPSWFEWVLPSPQTNIFLYQKCVGQEFLTHNGQHCPGGVDAVIYDASTNTQLAALYNPSAELSGFDYSTDRPSLAANGASWSFDGRFLAYRYYPESAFQTFNLAIFDLTTNANVTLDTYNEFVDSHLSFDWSPEGHRFLYWVKGRYGEDKEGDSMNSVDPVIYDVDRGQFIPGDHLFQLPPDYFGNPVTWSPDGQSFVFIDANQNLIHFDTNTGVTTMLDTHVSKVVVWN